MADDAAEVGDFVASQDLGDGVTDFRFEAHIPGYEGWQWSVTMYHDEELDHWTVNESSLLPTEKALLPPKWIPWKDRLEPTDLSVTDSIGTDPDDPRLEEGLSEEQLEAVVDAVEAEDKAEREQEAAGETKPEAAGEPAAESGEGTGEAREGDADANGEAPAAETNDPDADSASDTVSASTNGDGKEAPAADDAGDAAAKTSALDMAEAIDEFELSRRHVLSPLGRAQTAKRWYDGPHGPKALSTKTAGGSVCESCGFFIPLKGDLNRMFGVCANKWSPDDGRVVSLDHGCGEHSEIDPPQPSRLWVQSKPAFDDLHIDIVAQRPRDEHGEVELLERMGEGHRLASDGEDADDAAETTENESPATDATAAEEGAAAGSTVEGADSESERPAHPEESAAATPMTEASETESSDAGQIAADEPVEPDEPGEASSEEPESDPETEDDEAAAEADSDEATDEDIEAQTVPDDEATDEDIAEHAADPDEPEVVATVDLTKPADDGDEDDESEAVERDADEGHAEDR
ncbi:DUF3027 domain-containing protein [Bifidobacterium avesanii]